MQNSNLVTVTVDVSDPKISQAVLNLIALMSGSAVAPKQRTTVPKNKPVAKKEETPAADAAEEESDAQDEIFTLDALRTAAPAVAKKYPEAGTKLKAKIKELGYKNLPAMLGEDEDIQSFGKYFREIEKEYVK